MSRARERVSPINIAHFSYSFVAPQREERLQATLAVDKGMGCDSKTGIPWRRSRLTVLHAACDVLCGDRSARLLLRAGQNSKRRTCEGCVQ